MQPKPRSNLARLPIAAASLTAAAIIIHLLPGAGVWLQLGPAGTGAGHWWRYLTAHFTHWTLDHLLWDALALLAIGAIIERRARALLLITTLTSALLISRSTTMLQPTLTYRGLSGIDMALFAAMLTILVPDALRDRDHTLLVTIALAATLAAAKTTYELATGATLFVDTAAAGMAPVPLAHLVGALTGVACALPFAALAPTPTALAPTAPPARTVR